MQKLSFSVLSKNIFNDRLLLIIAPIFLLSIKHWINIIVIILSFLSIRYLIKKNIFSDHLINISTFKIKWLLYISLLLAFPFIVILITQILRSELFLPNFDNPLRLVLSVPIFLAISFGWGNNNTSENLAIVWIKFTIPGLLLSTLVNYPSWSYMRSISEAWGKSRITTYFVDALTFGSYTLLFGFISITVLIFYWNKKNYLFITYLFSCSVIGLYFSIMSGSRTGWISLPFFFLIWFITFGAKNFLKIKILFILLLFIIFLYLSLNIQPILTEKFKYAFEEIVSYKWNEVNSENSISMRISFIRMGIYYFLENPIYGWG